MRSFAAAYPQLLSQWSDKNDFGPDSVSYGSKKKAWRIHPCGHETEQAIGRWNNCGCPICSGKLIQEGVNDFSTTHPELAKQWSSKNIFKPESVSHGSTKKAWRKMDCGHEFEQLIDNWKKTKCPVCSYQLIVAGINDFATTHPELAKQWSDKNTIRLDSVCCGSSKKAWRIHPCGHETEQLINTWSTKGCSVCAGQNIIVGVNDFATTHPELAKQWASKNTLSSDAVSHGSKEKAWRKPPCGHEYQQSIASWKKYGCSICSGKKIRQGINDFATTHPELAEQWSGRNATGPESVSHGSNKIAWRKPPCGHEFQQKIADWKNYGCPKCATTVSKAEQEIFDFIKILWHDAQQSNRTLIAPRELDIYVPSKNIAIEFNGLYWHSEQFVGKNYHYEKWLACKNEGVQLITIWEDQWVDDKNKILKMLETKIVGRESVYARKCEVKEISAGVARDFLDSWHIQGATNAKYKIGIYYQDVLVGVALIGSTGELKRYASSLSIIGGLDRCLKYTGLKKFHTFADLCHSNGNLYKKTGWSEVKFIPPDYKYLAGQKLEHKFNYRKKRFETDPYLVYIEGATEKELAVANNLIRVYDCGKIKYSKELA